MLKDQGVCWIEDEVQHSCPYVCIAVLRSNTVLWSKHKGDDSNWVTVKHLDALSLQNFSRRDHSGGSFPRREHVSVKAMAAMEESRLSTFWVNSIGSIIDQIHQSSFGSGQNESIGSNQSLHIAGVCDIQKSWMGYWVVLDTKLLSVQTLMLAHPKILVGSDIFSHRLGKLREHVSELFTQWSFRNAVENVMVDSAECIRHMLPQLRKYSRPPSPLLYLRRWARATPFGITLVYYPNDPRLLVAIFCHRCVIGRKTTGIVCCPVHCERPSFLGVCKPLS